MTGPGDEATGRPALSARDLQVHFRRGHDVVRAVDGVDLDLRRGEILGLVGESGCGKTTLARCLLALEHPTAGTVSHDGAPVPTGRRAVKAYRRAVQLVLQDPTGALNPRHSVFEAVAEGLRIHAVPGDELELVSAALATAGLRPPERFLLRYPHELSGGQRQRVVTAMALINSPDLVICDEPTTALDVTVQATVLALLDRVLTAEDAACLFISHDLAVVSQLCSDVLVMLDGEIVETGATERIFTAPVHPYTQGLVATARLDLVEPGSRLPTVEDFYRRTRQGV